MWTHENRAKYNRDHLRYPSDLTDDEWTLVEPFIPPARRGGGKRQTDMRTVMNGVMYILSTGCQWRYLPKDFPPRSTVHNYFIWWQCDGVLDRIHHALYVECREKAQREGSPTACIIDSQSVKSAEKGGPASIHMAMMRARRSRARSAVCHETHRQGKEVWSCIGDEGGPLEAGSQVQASNRCKLRPSRATVVSVAEKSERDFGRWDPKRRAKANRR